MSLTPKVPDGNKTQPMRAMPEPDDKAAAVPCRRRCATRALADASVAGPSITGDEPTEANMQPHDAKMQAEPEAMAKSADETNAAAKTAKAAPKSDSTADADSDEVALLLRRGLDPRRPGCRCTISTRSSPGSAHPSTSTSPRCARSNARFASRAMAAQQAQRDAAGVAAAEQLELALRRVRAR